MPRLAVHRANAAPDPTANAAPAEASAAPWAAALPDQPDRLLLTPRAAAQALAIGERTLWNLTNRGELPCVRLGRSVRYDPADLRRFIEAQKAVPR